MHTIGNQCFHLFYRLHKFLLGQAEFLGSWPRGLRAHGTDGHHYNRYSQHHRYKLAIVKRSSIEDSLV